MKERDEMEEMTPEPLQNCEYFLVEYAPSALRQSHIAIGLFLLEPSGRLLQHGFTRDWRRLRCLDPQADLALLAHVPVHFEEIIRAATVMERPPSSTPAASSLYEELVRMQLDFSGSLQISSPRGVLTANPQEEFQRLFEEHVERPRPAAGKRLWREGSRPWIHARLSDAIERHALRDRLSRDIPVEEFTAPGDGFRIDFAYRPNGITKYLHAISLERDWNQTKLLSYTYWRIREKIPAQMTAIVADADPHLPAVESCRQILASAGIALQPLSLLDPYLEGVRRELHLM
jgi:hypothetical protein